MRREETGLRHCRCCSASSLTPREKGLFKNAGCCSEKMASPDFIPLGHKDLRPPFSFFSEQVALLQREKGSCRLSVVGCRWKAGNRGRLASSAPSAVKESAMHLVNPGFQKRGVRLQKKQKCFSQTPAKPQLATEIFIFRAKNCQ